MSNISTTEATAVQGQARGPPTEPQLFSPSTSGLQLLQDVPERSNHLEPELLLAQQASPMQTIQSPGDRRSRVVPHMELARSKIPRPLKWAGRAPHYARLQEASSSTQTKTSTVRRQPKKPHLHQDETSLLKEAEERAISSESSEDGTEASQQSSPTMNAGPLSDASSSVPGVQRTGATTAPATSAQITRTEQRARLRCCTPLST